MVATTSLAYPNSLATAGFVDGDTLAVYTHQVNTDDTADSGRHRFVRGQGQKYHGVFLVNGFGKMAKRDDK